MTAVSVPTLGRADDFVPARAARQGEFRSYARFLGAVGPAVAQPTPDAGVSALLVPGFLSGDVSLAVLSKHLRREGHRTFRAGVGANVGCTEAMVDRLATTLHRVAEAEGRPVVMVGHSRGGMITKLVARRHPDLVAAVVVLSAPVTGTLSVATHVRKQLELLFRLNARGVGRVLAADCVTGECAARTAAELQAGLPPAMPYLSVYSRNDAIIDWHTCLDDAAELVEVDAGHVGMGTHPQVLRIVAANLAAVHAGDAVRAGDAARSAGG